MSESITAFIIIASAFLAAVLTATLMKLLDYLRKKDAENAVYAFEKVLELNPVNKIALDNLDEASKLKE